jgi:hypothetical protein
MKSYSTHRALCGVTTISKASLRVPLLSTGAPAQLADLLDADASPEEVVIAYHERTKHFFHRNAASLGCMDWATQPDLFRRYPESNRILGVCGVAKIDCSMPKQQRSAPFASNRVA